MDKPGVTLLLCLCFAAVIEISIQADDALILRPERSLFLQHKVILDGIESSNTDQFEDKCDRCPQLCSPDKSTCTCYRGFIKVSEYHCQDVDECQEKEICGLHGKCINTLGSYVCRCQPGFQPLNSGKCIDINECALALKSKPCDQICTNLLGSYECSCHKGYNFSPKTGTCEDVNECIEEENACSHLCVNIPGSFVCRCPAPLSLAEDERRCTTGIKRHRKSPALLSRTPHRNEQEDIHRCPHKCLNNGVCRDGACHCPSGLNGKVCQYDVDECAVLPDDMKCSHFCINTFGSFRCGCRSGYILAADGKSCDLITCNPPCMGGGACQNGACICPAGLTGAACEIDVDECAKSHPCQQICHNTLGSFVCLCRGKWRLGNDGKSCKEPSCTPHCRNGGECHHGRCVCKSGFHGRICQLDINECAQKESPCSYACLNTVGSYQCLCPPGSKQSDNRTGCIVDTQADKDNQLEKLEVVIEVVVQDDVHSSFTRYYVTPVIPYKSTSIHQQKSVFPYQPLFKEQEKVVHVDHSRNYIQRQPLESSSSHQPLRIKTEETLEPEEHYNSVILPSHTESFMHMTSSSIYNAPSVVYESFEDINQNLFETPVLPTQKTTTTIASTVKHVVNEEITTVRATTTVKPEREEIDYSLENLESSEDHTTERDATELAEITTEESNDNLLQHKIDDSTTSSPDIVTEKTTPGTLMEEITAFENITAKQTDEEDSSTELPPTATPNIISEDLTLAPAEMITISRLEDTTRVYQNGTIEVPSRPKKKKINQRKKDKKKKKSKKKKGNRSSVLGRDFRYYNQILNTFGIDNHQGDAKQYDLIDFDEISAKEGSEAIKPKAAAFDLPVLKNAPLNHTELDCYYGRQKVRSRSHFYRDEKNCTRCICKDGELRCEPRHCPPARCQDPIKGNCCNYCPGDCVIDNHVYQSGETFVPELDPCRECRCEDGRAICSDLVCPALPCAPKHRAQLPDDCCPSCVPPSPGCFWNQQFFYTGQLWVQRQGGCQACLCREGGAVECNPVPCIVDCTHPQFVAGECCPVCDGCQYQDKKFTHGETFRHPSDSCSLCECKNGNIICFEETCHITCNHPYKARGKCCPECTDCYFENELIHEGTTRVFGRDNGTCTECSCKAGDIRCWAAECSTSCEIGNGTIVPSGVQFVKPDDHCTKCRCLDGVIGECKTQPCHNECKYGVLLPGACCIQCTLCDYKGMVYRDGQVFKEDQCMDCVCTRGNVQCENICSSEEDEEYDDDEEN